ncbi:hypothetical protein [Kitasatospora sp. MY 5-36]|uniref:hypothetical protein n=1 Tax=Kitasatospora sp. MY 5-36 TaxID=1678027 RepID=UPI000670E780|nr:hypothetical protein [Kitasatospora sp. MY 5-36]
MNTDRPAASGTAAPPVGADRDLGPGLGPLVRVDGSWYIGDHESKAYLAVLPEGFEHRVTGREPFLVPWKRLMSLKLGVTSGRFLSTPAGGLLTGHHAPHEAIGTHGSCLSAMVRHPYDLWSPRFVHHRRWYPAPEITLLHQLLGNIVDLGRVERLGDDAWLTSVVEELAADRLLRKWRTSKAVADGVRELIARGA